MKRQLTKSLLMALVLFLFNSAAISETLVLPKGDQTYSIDALPESGLLYLNGQWRVWWQQLLEPEEIDLESSSTIQMPGSWKGVIYDGGVMEENGYATFMMALSLPSISEPWAIRIPPPMTAYRLYVNNKLVSADGVVGKSREESEPGWGRHVVILPQTGNKLELVFQVSNFDFWDGGIKHSPVLGSVSAIKRIHLKALLIDAAVSAMLFAFAIVHLVLWYRRKQERASGFFTLLILCLVVYSLMAGEGIWFSLFPDIDWGLSVSINLLAMFWSVPAFAWYISALFPDDAWHPFRKVTLLMATLFSLYVVVMPSHMVSYTIPWYESVLAILAVYVLTILIIAVKRKRSGARLLLAGYLMLMLRIIGDISTDLGLIYRLDTIPLGMLGFALLQSVALFVRAADAFDAVERLQDEQPDFSHTDDPRTLAVMVMNQTLKTWERVTGEDRIAFAEKSGLWRAYLDGDTWRTRTLDKYLSIETLPAQPRWKTIIKSAEFVVASLKAHEKEDDDLLSLSRKLENQLLLNQDKLSNKTTG